MNFLLLMPCVFENRFITQSTKCTIFFVKLLYRVITLGIPTCFDPQGIIFRDETCRNTNVQEKTLGILLVECCEVAIRVLPNLIYLGLKLLFFLIGRLSCRS